VARLLRGQPAMPTYVARMRPINQSGPALLGARVPEPRPLSLDEARAAVARDAVVLDLRPAADHAVGHIPGSLSIPLGPSFGTWLGWVVPVDRPIVLILERSSDWDEAIRQALRIGSENAIVGHLQGGFSAWADAGLEQESNGRLNVAELGRLIDGDPAEAPLVIDVRQANEYAVGHVPGSVHISAGSLAERLAELPADRPIAAICASGFRASIAASILRAGGFRDVSWVANGVPAWRAAGRPIARGDDPAGRRKAAPRPDGDAEGRGDATPTGAEPLSARH